jgi:hypothetical protein
MGYGKKGKSRKGSKQVMINKAPTKHMGMKGKAGHKKPASRSGGRSPK